MTETITVGLGPNFVKTALRYCASDWQPSVHDEAVRVWFLAGAFPSIPAGDLLNVVKGTPGYAIKHTDHGFVLVTPDGDGLVGDLLPVPQAKHAVDATDDQGD
jgi:hypothetical protein